MDTDYYPNMPDIHEGDTVEILREPTTEERKVWEHFYFYMSSTISNTGIVTRKSYTMQQLPIYIVKFNTGEKWSYPAFLLRVIK